MGMDPTEAKIASDMCLKNATNRDECDKTPEQLLSWSGRQVGTTLPQFEIMDNEVTNAQYQQCVKADACTNPEAWSADKNPMNQPVTNLTWFQAEGYCSWLGGRLPKESEWEKAARGPVGNYFPWGNNWDSYNANLESHDENKGVRDISQYVDKDNSIYQVKNMAGNVREWTASMSMPLPNNQQFSDNDSPIENSTGNIPVIIRGGAWDLVRSEGLAATRRKMGTLSSRAYLGFRCVCPNGKSCTSPWDDLWWIWWSGKY
jgi:formylglycine-generating enzyme required for sulfatase activity